MPIPETEDFMLPLLRLIGNNGTMSIDAYRAALVSEFAITPREQKQRLAAERTQVYRSRIGWAGTYLVEAGLLERPARGVLSITDEGRRALARNPPHIDMCFLHQYESFREYWERTDGERTPNCRRVISETDPRRNPSPEDELFESYDRLRRILAGELLQRIKSAPPDFFEELVVRLLVAMGYGGSHEDAGHAIGGSGDGGIDGIIKEDRLGLDFVYIQAKRWDGAVGRPQIQAFAGSLEGRRAQKGVFITTSTFTQTAREYVNLIGKSIVLVDGAELTDLMLDYGIGVTDVATYKVQRIDPTYFGEE